MKRLRVGSNMSDIYKTDLKLSYEELALISRALKAYRGHEDDYVTRLIDWHINSPEWLRSSTTTWKKI